MPTIPVELLPVFFVIAMLHSSVGLAGGTTYTAVLALIGTPLAIIPFFAMGLNVLVASMASATFALHQYVHRQLVLACLLGSIPMVILGAQVQLPAFWFYAVLVLMLAVGMLRLAFNPLENSTLRPLTPPTLLMVVGLSAVLGFVSGSVGIGGGICLVPLLIFLRLASTKAAAATGALFILCNSGVGLLTKLLTFDPPSSAALNSFASLAGVVIVGGLLGAWLGAKQWQATMLQRVLASVMGVALVLLVVKMGSLP